jgi:hypothetical protein
MTTIDSSQIAHLVELRGVYDGWSIAVMKDGSLVNRWADDDGSAAEGYERRWAATDEVIALMKVERRIDS